MLWKQKSFFLVIYESEWMSLKPGCLASFSAFKFWFPWNYNLVLFCYYGKTNLFSVIYGPDKWSGEKPPEKCLGYLSPWTKHMHIQFTAGNNGHLSWLRIYYVNITRWFVEVMVKDNVAYVHVQHGLATYMLTCTTH